MENWERREGRKGRFQGIVMEGAALLGGLEEGA